MTSLLDIMGMQQPQGGNPFQTQLFGNLPFAQLPQMQAPQMTPQPGPPQQPQTPQGGPQAGFGFWGQQMPDTSHMTPFQQARGNIMGDYLKGGMGMGQQNQMQAQLGRLRTDFGMGR